MTHRPTPVHDDSDLFIFTLEPVTEWPVDAYAWSHLNSHDTFVQRHTGTRYLFARLRVQSYPHMYFKRDHGNERNYIREIFTPPPIEFHF